MVVVDTDVLAGLFIESPCSEAARALFERDPEWHSEAFVRVEYTNVLVAQVRAGRLLAPTAAALLGLADRVLGARLHRVDESAALTLAVRHQLPAYDARFLGVAILLQKRLVTEDAALRRKAPALTQSIDEALAA